MYLLHNTLILSIFVTAFSSSLGQASQVAEKCLQVYRSKALLSPQNIECSVDKISPCYCALAPLRDINFCCLVNNCLLSPEDAIYQWTVDCAMIGVPVPAFSIDIFCPENGGKSSPIVYAIPSRTIDYYRIDSTIGGEGYKGTITISHFIELTSSILESATSRESSFNINSKPSVNISAPFSPSLNTPLLPTTAPQPGRTSSPQTQKINTAGDSSPANKDEKKKLGLILGLRIPAAILALAAIFFFFWIRRLKSKKRRMAEAAEVGDENKTPRLSKERLSDILEEEGGGGCFNEDRASRLSELHSDPIPPYSRELPGTPAPQLIELPG